MPELSWAGTALHGEGDVKDVFVVADQARVRRDLEPVLRSDGIAADLRIFASRRLDLAADCARTANRAASPGAGVFHRQVTWTTLDDLASP